MNAKSEYWMNYSIDISQKASHSILHVGVVLVSENNELVCSAFTGENCNASWCSVLMKKIRELKISSAQSIYIMINTLSKTHVFDLLELLTEVRVNEIYVGLPDPTLSCYMDNDPIITHAHVHRYPDKLQREILKQNIPFYTNSTQSIKNSPYYSKNRISSMVIESLKLKGFVISQEELNANKQGAAVASLICNKYKIKYEEAFSTVQNTISEAFNSKYGSYTYLDDARSLDPDWKENFISFYKRSSAIPIFANNILNVGVGNGHEATILFSNCAHVTFVDIAQAGLEQIKRKKSSSKIIVSNADDLSSIPDNHYDLYVSLRTFNSSFFDIKNAVSEAHRVLKPNAIIIVSVANGFLCPDQRCIIPGLIIPGTEFVDIYRGIDTVKLMQKEFLQARFNNFRLFPTNTELYPELFTAV